MGALLLGSRERKLLALRSGREVQRRLGLENAVRPALIDERVVQIADCGVRTGDVADGEQRLAAVRTEGVLELPKGTRMQFECLLVVSASAVHVCDVREQPGKARIFRPEYLLPDRERTLV